MKRKIAVFGNGWSNEYLKIVIKGIRKCAEENNADVFLFVDYSSSDDAESTLKTGETSIFNLPRLEEFDGAVLLANTLHYKSVIDFLSRNIIEKHIPAVSLEYEIDGIDYIGTDNYSGMYEMTAHLIEEHNVRNVLFMSGPDDNQESNTRRQAVEDALEKSGLKLLPENVVCGNFSYDPAKEALQKWLDLHTELPDAIMCANDVMAMAVCAVLEQKGINVPHEILVTGFDRLNSGITFSPMLASVSRSWDDIGYRGMQHLLDKLDGKEVDAWQQIPSKAVPAESCGCQPNKESIEVLRESNKMGYNRLVDNVFLGGRMCSMAEYMAGVRTENELYYTLGNFWKRQKDYGVEEIYLCLHSSFFSSLKNNEVLPQRSYSRCSDLICGLRDGQLMERQLFETASLVPGYDGSSTSHRFYILLSVHWKSENYGYVVFGDEIPMLYDYTLSTWMTNMGQNLERVRQNLKMEDMYSELARMSVTDSLTSLYNRTACEKMAYPLLERCHNEEKNCALLFADINKMKVINDKFGHYHGDLAICTVAGVLKEVLPLEWIVLRYGGDEFMAAGECTDEQQVTSYVEQIMKRLEMKTNELELPYKLKASAGFIVIRPQEELDPHDCLKKADEAMYSMKEIQHRENFN